MQGRGCRFEGVRLKVQGAGCRVQVAGLRVEGAGCRVQGLGFHSVGLHRPGAVMDYGDRV